ncbi:hypothetical protein ACSW9O_15200 (plasmid) [Clostridium perfringens]
MKRSERNKERLNRLFIKVSILSLTIHMIIDTIDKIIKWFS